MGVIEPGDGLCFTLEEASRVRGSIGIQVGNDFAANHLNGDLAIDARILGKVDLSHATAANQA